jgi:hypothetical protein
MNLKTFLLLIGIFLIAVGLLVNISISQVTQSVISFAEQDASKDQVLSVTSRTRIVLSILTAAIITIYSGVMLLAAREQPTRSSLLKAMRDNPFHGTMANTLKSYRILLLSTLLTLAFIALYVWRIIDPALNDLYDEGNLIETLTAIAFGVSSIFVLLAIRSRLQANAQRGRSSKWWLLPYISIMLGLFVLAMEEINWGQAYLGWQTPESLSALNRQGETNLHNIVEAFEWLYYPLALLFPLEIFSGWLRRRVSHRSIVLRILPRPNTVFLAAVLSTLAYIAVGINEFVEQLFALFTLFYSFSMYSAEKHDLAMGQ